tara:strand:+ start:189 stop:797 length:609 start_codon:yes stop_codon:yes gene_type:complete
LLITGCGYRSVFDSNYYCKKLNLDCLKNNQTLVFKTSKGNIDIKLYGEEKPVTVSNFLKNVKNNIYVNKRFYKIIDFPQVQLIHSGIDQGLTSSKKENQNLKKLTRNIPLEIKLKKEIEPKYSYQILDPSEIINLTNFFENGSLAMAKSGEKNSSSTEFFFVTNKFPELDGRYSIFGKVVKGIEILQKIDEDDLIYEIIINN